MADEVSPDDVNLDKGVPLPEAAEKPKQTGAKKMAEAKQTPAKKDDADKPKWMKTYPKAKPVKIILEENEDIPPTGLFVSINGDAYVIVAGEEVEVPDFVLDHLDNCVISKPRVNPQTRQVTGYRDRARFPYRIVGQRGNR